ncbi:hypothetical protein FACS1894181_13970 [Bacteroidia bacterium]|nr:hypothetical protein FACS1894181_13970 [Bacteroidia bacterium]
MRTPSLQYLYMQKPITMVALICALAVLPWIGLSDFSTKGEPREAAVAVSMLQTGNWVLPGVYADEFAYKPPFTHWIMAVFSLPQGHVSEFTARLPSALAYIFLIGFTLFFFGERVKFQEAFIAALLLATCFEIHRAGLAARVDMVTTAFIVLSLYALYWWEERLELKGLPISIPLLLGCATLAKGPVGVVLPLFVFGVYLLVLKKYRPLVFFKALFYAGVSSLFLPLVWYVAAWRQGGDDFLNVVLAENFGRFFHIGHASLNYDLGHENGLWYNPAMLLAGFIPWSLLACFSLFGMKYRLPQGKLSSALQKAWTQIRSMEKLKLFSLVAAACILFFYSIPSSKRGVYIMPAYPFVALFLAEYLLHIATYREKVTRVFAGFLAATATLVFALAGAIMAGFDLASFAARFMHKAPSLIKVEAISKALASPDYLTVFILSAGLLALCSVFYHISKKNNLKVLYATIFLAFSINLLIDGVVMRSIHNESSAQPFAEHITKEYSLSHTNTYVMNNLKEYANLYGLNFYMNNTFLNFEKEQPESGYFLVAEKDADKATNRYAPRYHFHLLATSPWISDLNQKILLFQFHSY